MNCAPLDICRRRLGGRWRSRKRRTFAREFLCRPAPSTARPCLPPRCRGRGPGWGSARFHARDARRVELTPQWQFSRPSRAATSRWAANARRTVYPRRCRAPRPPRRGSKDWFCSSCLLSPIHRQLNLDAHVFPPAFPFYVPRHSTACVSTDPNEPRDFTLSRTSAAVGIDGTVGPAFRAIGSEIAPELDG